MKARLTRIRKSKGAIHVTVNRRQRAIRCLLTCTAGYSAVTPDAEVAEVRGDFEQRKLWPRRLGEMVRDSSVFRKAVEVGSVAKGGDASVGGCRRIYETRGITSRSAAVVLAAAVLVDSLCKTAIKERGEGEEPVDRRNIGVNRLSSRICPSPKVFFEKYVRSATKLARQAC